VGRPPVGLGIVGGVPDCVGGRLREEVSVLAIAHSHCKHSSYQSTWRLQAQTPTVHNTLCLCGLVCAEVPSQCALRGWAASRGRSELHAAPRKPSARFHPHAHRIGPPRPTGSRLPWARQVSPPRLQCCCRCRARVVAGARSSSRRGCGRVRERNWSACVRGSGRIGEPEKPEVFNECDVDRCVASVSEEADGAGVIRWCPNGADPGGVLCVPMFRCITAESRIPMSRPEAGRERERGEEGVASCCICASVHGIVTAMRSSVLMAWVAAGCSG
jgi:hypothetical protein